MKTYWQKIPVWARLLVIVIGIPAVIAISRVLLERRFSRNMALYIVIIVLIICSLPLILRNRS